jgi:hypothetical protein
LVQPDALRRMMDLDAVRRAALRDEFTYFRDRLEIVKVSKHKNVTLSLPEPLLRRFRIYAATRNQSMTSLMAESIRRMIDEDFDADRAARRFMARIENAPDRGTGGVIPWTRGELHER